MSLLPPHLPRPLVGLIGGSGLYAAAAAMETLATLDDLVTPFGPPAAPIVLARTAAGTVVAFLARHGLHHQHPPSRLPARANMAALHLLGCQAVLAFSAVGSLRESLRPGDFALPAQLLDRTVARAAESSMFGDVLASHVSCADPFSQGLRDVVQRVAASAVPHLTLHAALPSIEAQVSTPHDLTVVTIEGPRFSTRAESLVYRASSCDLINMTACPEAFLARELELPYALICMVTDYDCWRTGQDAVAVDHVMRVMRRNATAAADLMVAAVDEVARVHTNNAAWTQVRREVAGAMQHAVMTHRDALAPDTRKRLALLLPQYFAA